MPQLSVIIPAYNEEYRLPPTLESVYAYLTGKAISFEIIVVDDGSTDHTIEAVEAFAKHHDGIRLLAYAPNQGKGHAVRTGMLAAGGDLLLLDDADGSSPISEIERLIKAVDGGADVAIGSRNKPEVGVTVEARSYRKHIGNTFNLIVQSLLLPGLNDTQCGFKLFKREAARNIFAVAHLNGYAFDVEVLFIAKILGYKIDEIAIDWHHVRGSKVNVLLDSPKMLFEVFRITIGAMFGRYKRFN